MSEITVEPVTVWAAFGTFVLGMFVGVLVVQSEARRALRWREATRWWHEIQAVAVELRDEHKELLRLWLVLISAGVLGVFALTALIVSFFIQG